MAAKALPCPTLLRLLMACDPDTGALWWKPRPLRMFSASGKVDADARWRGWNNTFAGKPALACVDRRGYRAGNILGRSVQAHRAMWALVHGAWPSAQIDHINGNRADNRIANLRPATSDQNAKNRKSRAGSSSAYLGVDFCKPRNRWRAQIKPSGIKTLYLGLFDDEVEAAMAYDQAAKKHHGEFARLNFPDLG